MLRITPAHAGKSRNFRGYSLRVWDHPRTRGEKRFRHFIYRPEPGSPPHTRGKARGKALFDSMRRITPAHAGKRQSLSCSLPQERDHPRTRGEKLLIPLIHLVPIGSPPHTRGKATLTFIRAGKSGITPAHAGKSSGGCCRIHGQWDHPRTRGEKWFSCSRSVCVMGSPPHTRGKDSFPPSRDPARRITPAHAGKSCTGTQPFINR